MQIQSSGPKVLGGDDWDGVGEPFGETLELATSLRRLELEASQSHIC
jgi:hypothetical protein